MIGSARPPPDHGALYETAPCGLLLTETDGLLLDVNATFCAWTGWKAEELIGRRKLQSLLTVGAQIFHQTHWAPLLHMQGSVAEVKVDLVASDGRPLPTLMNAVRLETDGRAVHQIALIVAADRHKYERALLEARHRADAALLGEQMAKDELRQARSRLQLALDSAQLLVWEALPGSPSVRSYQPGAARLLGLPETEPVEHAAFEAAMQPGEREREARALAAALQDPAGHYACTFHLDGADGVQRVISSTGQGEFDAEGRMLRIIGVLQDVTEASLQRSTAEDRALLAEQMIGIVSHDLRNPLAVISMSQAALERSAPTEVQRTHLERIARSTARSQRLISDLLDFTAARIGAGIPVHLRPFDLAQLIRNAVDDLRSAYPQRVIRDGGSGSGECVADADRIVQLVGNLVSNAVHYGSCNHPITVSWSIGATQYQIAVHNQGPPIDPEIIPALFQPMMQPGGSSRARANGRSVGLGLFIVSQIARAHAGRVTVESSAGSGTCFTAHFPRSASTPAAS